MENLPKDLIAAGQSKNFEELQEIVEKCDAKTVSVCFRPNKFKF